MTRHPFGISALALGLALVLPLLVPPARAQYIFLDSNGDGAHTSADEVHEVGPTVIDVWLDVGHNKDGSVAVCNVPGQPLDMFEYEVALEAIDGTLDFSSFTNRMPEMVLIITPPAPDGTRYWSGAFYTTGHTSLPPGRYHLGTLTVNVSSGTPSLQIVPKVIWTTPSTFESYTFFGSHCDGTLYPNSIALGIDWFDADGLPYGSGGVPNQAPRLAALANMAVPSGENATQVISATDPEGQPLTFAKASGPPFMSVTSMDPGSGTALGEVRLAPFLSDVGSASGGVSVTDGAASHQATFGITVSHGPNHVPYFAQGPTLAVIAGQVSNFLLSAGDADGGTLHFAKVSGPAYVSLRELASRPGGASALVTVKPAVCDTGSAVATFSVSDGAAQQQRQVTLSVVPSSLPPVAPIRYFLAGFMNRIRLGDMNGDGNLDAVSVQESRPTISVFLGDGRGFLGSAVSTQVVGLDGAIAIADFDRDGRQDVALTNPGGASVDVLHGRGDGTFLPGVTYETGSGPTEIAAADLNRDGILDLVTMNQGSVSVSVLLGTEDGTFGAKQDSPSRFRPNAFTVADFNLDGRPDVVLASPPGTPGGTFTILPGLGNGTFGTGVESPFDGYPYSLVSGDWNWDGAADLALVDHRSTVQTFSGRGDGTFAPGVIVASAPEPSFLYAIAAVDLNGDGNSDLVAADVNASRLLVLLGNGAGGFASPIFQPNRAAQGLVAGDMNSDGRPDMVASYALNMGIFLNTFLAPASVASRAFVAGGNRPVPQGDRNLCLRIELSDESSGGKPQEEQPVDPATVVLRSEGTGSVSEIHAFAAARKIIVSDTDGNNRAEVDVCFASQDVATLFDKLTRRTRVTAQVAGAAMDGRLFCTIFELNVGEKSTASVVTFAPNPFNPRSKLTFSTTRDGPARAMIFDIQGRLVRRLLDVPRLPAGAHGYLFDGRNDRGAELPSSVYFYRVESIEGRFGGRIVILK